MITIDEQKLAVCGKLKELIRYEPKGKADFGGNYEGYHAWNSNGLRINWPTEGLQVCHEAEKLLNAKRVINEDASKLETEKSIYFESISKDATYKQRLEALCQVWWPEKWSK